MKHLTKKYWNTLDKSSKVRIWNTVYPHMQKTESNFVDDTEGEMFKHMKKCTTVEETTGSVTVKTSWSFYVYKKL